MRFKENKIPNCKILIMVVLLITPIFIISCVDNKGQGSRADMEPQPIPKELTIEAIEPEPDPPKPVIVNENYSPGNTDWTLPTQDEQNKWDHEIYVAALEKWAKPKLDNWFCQSCKEKLGKDFKFLDRDGNNIRFKCKCNCGHTHTVTLQGK